MDNFVAFWSNNRHFWHSNYSQFWVHYNHKQNINPLRLYKKRGWTYFRTICLFLSQKSSPQLCLAGWLDATFNQSKADLLHQACPSLLPTQSVRQLRPFQDVPSHQAFSNMSQSALTDSSRVYHLLWLSTIGQKVTHFARLRSNSINFTHFPANLSTVV